MGFFSTIGAFGRRGAIGAGVGAGLGFANTGDLGGVIGGAAAGGAAFGFGGEYIRGLAERGIFSSGLSSAAVGLARGTSRMAGKMGMAASGMTNQYAKFGMAKAARGMGATAWGSLSANKFIGNNAVAVNKWGGRAASAAGIGAAAYIGSSVIGSNRGY